MILSAVMGGLAYTMIGKMSPPHLLPKCLPGLRLMIPSFSIRSLLFLQGIIAVVAIWAGVSLLRLNSGQEQQSRCCLGLRSFIRLGSASFGLYVGFVDGPSAHTRRSGQCAVVSIDGGGNGSDCYSSICRALWIMIDTCAGQKCARRSPTRIRRMRDLTRSWCGPAASIAAYQPSAPAGRPARR